MRAGAPFFRFSRLSGARAANKRKQIRRSALRFLQKYYNDPDNVDVHRQSKEVIKSPIPCLPPAHYTKMPSSSRSRDSSDEVDAKSPAAKRSKAAGANADTGLSLNEDALSLVLELLPPRDLYAAALTCKSLRAKITVAITVKSVLIQNGRGKQTLDELKKLLCAKSIHPPSALRLLRLVNGRRCEICNRSKVNHIRPGIGIFSCWTCLTERGLTKGWKKTWVRYRKNVGAYEGIFQHPRVAAQEYGKTNYLMHVPRTDATGEFIGPVVCFDDIDKMFAHEASIDDYLDNTLGAPSADRYAEFNSAYEITRARAERVARERIDKYRAENQKRRDEKKAKVEQWIANLSGLIDESFRNAALKRKDMAHSASSKQPCVQFLLPFVDGLLKEYVLAPSKMRKKNMKDVADKINSKLQLIDDRNFLNLNFLSEDDAFEGALKNHFSNKLSGIDELLATKAVKINAFNRSTTISPIDAKFFTLLEDEKLVVALAHLKDDNLSSLLLPQGAAVQHQDLLANLANNIWWSKLKQEDQTNDGRFGRAFAASQTSFGDARLAIDAYILWLQEKYPGEDQQERRDHARKESFERVSGLVPLLERDFEKLNKLHQRDYRWNLEGWDM